MILAASNINPTAFSDDNINLAWVSKFEQTYQKAKIAFGDSPDFARIQEIYATKKKETGKVKSQRNKIRIGCIIGIVVCLALSAVLEGQAATVSAIGAGLCCFGLLVAFCL